MKIDLSSSIPGEQNHVLLFSSLAFVIGCALQPMLMGGKWPWFLFAAGILLFVLLLFCRRKAFYAFALCFFALGLLRTNAAFSLPAPEPGSYQITATLCGEPTEKDGKKLAMVLKDITLNGRPVSGKAYYTLNTTYIDGEIPSFFDGARLSFEGKAYLPEGKSGPYHFDFQRWMLLNHYSFGISSYQCPTVLNTRETAPIADLASRIRNRVRSGLYKCMGKDTDLAMALLFGDKSGLTDEETSSFQKLGIAHLMSVSGMHIAIFGGFVLAILDKLKTGRWVRLPILACSLSFYSWLCGYSVASVRATTMMLLGYLGRLLLHHEDRRTFLAFTAMLVLWFNPLQVSSSGFLLSFSAMLGVLSIARPVREFLDRLWPTATFVSRNASGSKRRTLYRKFQMTVKSNLSLSIAAQIGILLPTAAFFHVIPAYGLLMNFVFVPIVSTILMPVIALSALLSFVPFVGTSIGTVSGKALSVLLNVIQKLSDLPGASIRVPNPGLIFSLGCILSFLLLSRLTPGKAKVKVILSFLCLLVTIGVSYLTRPEEVRYIQLSCGQADASILTDGNTTIVIDTGEDGREVLDYLQNENRSVDALYLTHLHTDHAGGVKALLDQKIPVRVVYLPEGADTAGIDPEMTALFDRIVSEGVPVQYVARGDSHEYPHFTINILWPEEGKVRKNIPPNDFSMVLKTEMGAYSILSMGDVGQPYETLCAEEADVLKVGHHGSASASSEEFLSAVSPAIAMVTCSSTSSTLPSAAAMERLNGSGATILRTDQTGDVILSLKKGTLKIRPYRGKP